jgi:FkbM family methyltransferase
MRAVFPPNDETRLVRDFFDNQTAGFFVEVGANDPVVGSQSWHLEQMGWKGILVEPQPVLADKLREARSAKVYAVACSSQRNAGGTMPLHIAGPFSSFDPALMVPGVRPEASIDVPVWTLDAVLADAGAPVPVDFLSVDVEGHEIEVLGGFDFARWRPRLILLEDHVVGLAKHFFLQRARYKLIRRTGLNGWYVPRDQAPKLGWDGCWQIVRKYYLGLPFRVLRDFKRRIRDRIRDMFA